MFFIFHCQYPMLILIFLHYSNYSWKALQCIFFQATQTKIELHKLQLWKSRLWWVQNKQCLFCLVRQRQNIHSWSYFATSWIWLAELGTRQVWTAWLSQLTDFYKCLSLVDRQCLGFSAGEPLAGSCLHCVNCRLNQRPCLFTYCTCHMTTSTNCVWLKANCTLIGWFHPSCLLHSIAILRLTVV